MGKKNFKMGKQLLYNSNKVDSMIIKFAQKSLQELRKKCY